MIAERRAGGGECDTVPDCSTLRAMTQHRHGLADRHRRLHPGLVGDAVRGPAAVDHPLRARRSRPFGRRAATAAPRAETGGDHRGGGGHLGRDLHRRQRAVVQFSRIVR